METYQIVILVVACILILLFIIFVIYSSLVFSFALSSKYNPKPNQDHAISSPDKKYTLKYDLAWLKNSPFEIVQTQGFDNLTLTGHLLTSPSSHLYVISFHGYRGAYEELSIPTRNMHEDLNANILMIEQRGQGTSTYPIMTFGELESKDALSWIDFIVTKDPEAKIFLYGLSMGATTIINASKYIKAKQVKGLIADCGFSSSQEEMKYILKKPLKFSFLVNLTYLGLRFIAKVRYHFSLGKDNPITSLKENDIPILFIHGEDDTFVPFKMLEENYQAVKETTYKEKEVFPHTWHALSFTVDPSKYKSVTQNFIKKFNKD